MFTKKELNLMRRGLEAWEGEFNTGKPAHAWDDVFALIRKLKKLIKQMEQMPCEKS